VLEVVHDLHVELLGTRVTRRHDVMIRNVSSTSDTGIWHDWE
jgi:hypothetical protein